MSPRADNGGVNQMTRRRSKQQGIAMNHMRSNFNVKKCLVSGAVLLAALMPCIAAAALGEPEASVQTDAVQLHGSLKLTERTGYREHEIKLSSGTVLREFAGADGKVFAVAWNGPTVPNLRQTFGSYFDGYVSGAKIRHAGHSQLEVRLSDLVVQSSGHMRAFSGRAYLPRSIPAGVDIGDIR